MKEIGEKLKKAREATGISIEEAAEDLKMRPSQIESIENGDMEQFKDVFYLKYFIRDYSKYLGIDYEAMVDEFNEYLFDYTSKLSIDEIKKAKKDLKEPDPVKITSPYTLEYKRVINKRTIVTIVLAFIILLVIIFYIIQLF